jgi:hypothetical protein
LSPLTWINEKLPAIAALALAGIAGALALARR